MPSLDLIREIKFTRPLLLRAMLGSTHSTWPTSPERRNRGSFLFPNKPSLRPQGNTLDGLV